MSFQSQTYANSNSGYYVENAAPFNPNDPTALNGPVEILFTSTIQGAYYGLLNQTPSTFTISENNVNLSTINYLEMDPNVPKITLGINNINNPSAEPVIQQWSLTSSIVNGIFKVGNKQINDEPNALIMANNGNITSLRGGNELNTLIDGANQRTRFTSVGDPQVYVDIGQGYGPVPKGNVKCASDVTNANIIMNPDIVSFNASAIPYGRTGVGNIAPNTYYMTARTGIDFVTDDINEVLTPLSLKQDGTATMISTLNVPVLRQGNIIQTIDNTNSRNRFSNVADSATAYVEINQIPATPGISVVNNNGQTKVTVSTISFSDFTTNPTQIGKIGTKASAVGSFLIESAADTQIRTSLNNLSTAVFNANGTTNLLSTLKVPYISTLDILATNISTINLKAIDTLTTNLQATSISTINLQATDTLTTNLLATNISSLNIVATNANLLNISTMHINNGPTTGFNQPIQVNGSLEILKLQGSFGAPGINSLATPRIKITNVNNNPEIYYPAAEDDCQIQVNLLQYNHGAPVNSQNSLEFIQNSGNTQGGIQFYHGDNNNRFSPTWLGGFQNNPKQFILESTVTAVLPTTRGTNANIDFISTIQINQNSSPGGYILVEGSMLIDEAAGPNGAAGVNHITSPRVKVRSSGINPPIFYPAQNGESQIVVNALENNYGAPTNAQQCMEFVNNSTSGVGGFQFYHGNNTTQSNPQWLGGFQNNPQEFRLASTMTASLPNITDTQTASISALSNISSINALPISDYLGVPRGTMLSWAGQSASQVPNGYLLCDGGEYAIAGIYNALFIMIGSWGAPAQPYNFKVPDSRGKMLAGSVTISSNSGLNGALTITATFQGVVTVTLPASYGGGTRVGMYVTNPTGQLMEGMEIITNTFTALTIQGFINSDGRYGSYTPAVTNRDIVIIFQSDLLSYPGTGGIVQFATTGNNVTAFPYVTQNWNPGIPAIGTGYYGNVQKAYEIAPHFHPGRTAGNQVSAPGNTRTEPANGDTGYNNELFSYIERTSQITVNGNLALYNLPYNVATWQIIKY